MNRNACYRPFLAPHYKPVEAETSKINTNLWYENLIKINQLILMLSHENKLTTDDDADTNDDDDTDDDSAIPIYDIFFCRINRRCSSDFATIDTLHDIEQKISPYELIR